MLLVYCLLMLLVVVPVAGHPELPDHPQLIRELVEGQERFIKYYLMATEDVMLYASTWNT